MRLSHHWVPQVIYRDFKVSLKNHIIAIYQESAVNRKRIEFKRIEFKPLIIAEKQFCYGCFILQYILEGSEYVYHAVTPLWIRIF